MTLKSQELTSKHQITREFVDHHSSFPKFFLSKHELKTRNAIKKYNEKIYAQEKKKEKFRYPSTFFLDDKEAIRIIEEWIKINKEEVVSSKKEKSDHCDVSIDKSKKKISRYRLINVGKAKFEKNKLLVSPINFLKRYSKKNNYRYFPSNDEIVKFKNKIKKSNHFLDKKNYRKKTTILKVNKKKYRTHSASLSNLIAAKANPSSTFLLNLLSPRAMEVEQSLLYRGKMDKKADQLSTPFKALPRISIEDEIAVRGDEGLVQSPVISPIQSPIRAIIQSPSISTIQSPDQVNLSLSPSYMEVSSDLFINVRGRLCLYKRLHLRTCEANKSSSSLNRKLSSKYDLSFYSKGSSHKTITNNSLEISQENNQEEQSELSSVSFSSSFEEVSSSSADIVYEKKDEQSELSSVSFSSSFEEVPSSTADVFYEKKDEQSELSSVSFSSSFEEVSSSSADVFYEKKDEQVDLYDLKKIYKENSEKQFDYDVKVRANLKFKEEIKIQEKITNTVIEFAKVNDQIDNDKLFRCLCYLMIANIVKGVSLKEKEFREKIDILKKNSLPEHDLNSLNYKEAKKFSTYFQSQMNKGEVILKTGLESNKPSSHVNLQVGFRTKRVPLKLTEKIFNDNLYPRKDLGNFTKLASKILNGQIMKL